jgi:RNA polymerase sigma factor (sigma-70 family)
MASSNQDTFRRGIERIVNQGSLTGMGEGQLLRQYAVKGDEAAFEAMVTRHGPMVLSVFRRVLYDPRDVEDAFQATFLVLLRRAGSLESAARLSPWLHGVAYRAAARIRANAARRRSEERTLTRPEAMEFACDVEQHEVRGILDEEIHRLPESELANGLVRTMILAKLKLVASVVAAGAIVLAMSAALLVTLPHSVAHDGEERHGMVVPKAQLPEAPSSGVSSGSEQGQPVAAVEVKPMIWTRTTKSTANSRSIREEFDSPNPVSTDAQGQWRWHKLPAGIEPQRV